MFNSLPDKFRDDLNYLSKLFRKYTDRVYIVGGATRDWLLGLEIKDLDIEIFGVEIEQFEELMQKIGAVGVGKSFFVYKWRDFDISLPRLERKVKAGHRGFEVELAKSEREATKRRDFTVNTLMYNIYSAQTLNFYSGVEDLELKTLRVTDRERFSEDSLRVLRAMQFSSRFKFKIDTTSIEIMQNIELNDLSKERIFLEFEKMFNSNHLHYGLYYLFKLKIAKKLFDLDIDFKTFLKSAKEFKQNHSKFERESYKFYFLYILSKNLNLNPTKIAKELKAPKSYIKRLSSQKYIPKNISNRFLVALSLKYPLKSWLGNYSTIERAKELNIYQTKFNPEVDIEEILKKGFKKREIAKEIERISLLRVKESTPPPLI